MSKHTHTPGPWRLVNVPYVNLRMRQKIGPAVLVNVISDADAYKMAAAPDMYEALKAFVGPMKHAPGSAEVVAAHKALAKAEGKE